MLPETGWVLTGIENRPERRKTNRLRFFIIEKWREHRNAARNSLRFSFGVETRRKAGSVAVGIEKRRQHPKNVAKPIAFVLASKKRVNIKSGVKLVAFARASKSGANLDKRRENGCASLVLKSDAELCSFGGSKLGTNIEKRRETACVSSAVKKRRERRKRS